MKNTKDKQMKSKKIHQERMENQRRLIETMRKIRMTKR